MRFLAPVFLIMLASMTLTQSNAGDTNLDGIDAAATMLGSIRSWMSNEPEAAIHAFHQHAAINDFVLRQRGAYGLTSGGRLQDRMAQIDSGLESWDDAVQRFQLEAPKQIATELRRQSNAVARYKKSKSPRPSSFAYIPKTVWKTRDKLDVLAASGFDTADLVAEQERVQQEVLALVASMDVEQLAKSNGSVRDRYRRDDRASIEAFVEQQWSRAHPDLPATELIMPSQSWSKTYSAQVDPKTGSVSSFEVARMTIYVATSKSDTVRRLHPMRLRRTAKGIMVIPTNEFIFDVLKK